MKMLILAGILTLTACGTNSKTERKTTTTTTESTGGCSVVQFGDESTGTSTVIACDDGSMATISPGKDGADGKDGESVKGDKGEQGEPGTVVEADKCRIERRNYKNTHSHTFYDVYLVCADSEEFIKTTKIKR